MTDREDVPNVDETPLPAQPLLASLPLLTAARTCTWCQQPLLPTERSHRGMHSDCASDAAAEGEFYSLEYVHDGCDD